MNYKANEITQAKSALSFIVPLLEKYNFKWVITGGFACYVYGVNRMLTDIDIDIATSKDSNEFQEFYKELEKYITQPLENFVDENYNNFNFEFTYNGQIIDVCPMKELMIFNKSHKTYESFYKDGFPVVEVANFEGFDLPLLSKQAIIENKEMLTKKDEWQQRDINELRNLIAIHSK
jgi:hypothetical protein